MAVPTSYGVVTIKQVSICKAQCLARGVSQTLQVCAEKESCFGFIKPICTFALFSLHCLSLSSSYLGWEARL